MHTSAPQAHTQALAHCLLSLTRPTNATLDASIAAFALNLEYLEAEFYSWAAYGHGIPECKGMSVGGQKANLSSAVQAYAEEIGES